MTEYTYVIESTELPDRVVVHVTAGEVQALVKELWGGECEDRDQVDRMARQEVFERFDRWWEQEGKRLKENLSRRFKDKVIR